MRHEASAKGGSQPSFAAFPGIKPQAYEMGWKSSGWTCTT